MKVQSVVYALCDIGDCEIYFPHVPGHSVVYGNDTVDQLATEANGLDIHLSVSVPLLHFKHLASLENVWARNSGCLFSSKFLSTKRFFRTIFQRHK